MKALLNPWVLLAVTLLVIGSGAYGYRQGSIHKADSIAAQTARDEAMEKRVFDAAQKAAATAISKIKVERVAIHERTEKEIERIPAECVAPNSLHDITNEAITGIVAPRDSVVPVPGPDGGPVLP